MNTKEKLTEALKDAMRAKDNQRKSTLRGALAAIKLAEVEKREDLEETAMLSLVQKEVKLRRETIADAEKAERPDLIEAAQAEIAILEVFLPEALTPEEVEKLVIEAIAETGAETPKEMGNVMKVLIPRIQGRADGKMVSNIVRQRLQQED